MPIAPSLLDSPFCSSTGLTQQRSWHARFDTALRGLKRGVRGHASFFVHFFFAALVGVAAFVLHCTPGEWCILLLCIGMVLVAELFHSALETLVRGLDREISERVKPCLEIATGAVLVAGLTAGIVG